MSDNDLINKGLSELRSMGADLEQAVKSASEEAKDGWKKLQPHIQQAEKMASQKASELAQEVGESTGDFITDVRGRLEELRKRINEERN